MTMTGTHIGVATTRETRENALQVHRSPKTSTFFPYKFARLPNVKRNQNSTKQKLENISLFFSLEKLSQLFYVGKHSRKSGILKIGMSGIQDTVDHIHFLPTGTHVQAMSLYSCHHDCVCK